MKCRIQMNGVEYVATDSLGLVTTDFDQACLIQKLRAMGYTKIVMA
jgi:hypothetical protein